jgi:hypothetical protein
MTQRRGQELPAWLEAVEADDLPELRSFAAGIRRDLSAVINGLTLEHSSGWGECDCLAVLLPARSPARAGALARTTSGSRGSGGRTSCQGRSRRTLGRPPISGAPTSAPGSWPRSRRAGCQASSAPWASVRPIATSAHPARCLTERQRRQGTWGPCRRADLRSSLSRWRASSSIMYGCIVFTY